MKSTIVRTGLDALYFTGAYLLMRPFFAGVGAIFMLHHVRPPRDGGFQPNKSLEVSPQFLAQTIAWLRREGIELISLDEMHRRITEHDCGRRFACITFDDGYRDNKRWAYPILKEYAAPFAIYVPTSFPDRRGKMWWLALERVIAGNHSVAAAIEGKEQRFDCSTDVAKRETYERLYWWLRQLPAEAAIHDFVDDLAVRYGVNMAPVGDELCMDWNEIRALAADPLVTIGAHTVNHVMLAKASDAAVRSELTISRQLLEVKLGTAVRHLAYPYGGRDLVGTREVRIARELGYKTAVTTRPGVLFPEHDQHLTALPRISLNGQFQQPRHNKVLMSGAATALWNGFRRVDAA